MVFVLYYPALGNVIVFNSQWSGEEAGGFSLGFVPLLFTTFFGGRGWSIYIYLLLFLTGVVVATRKNAVAGMLLPTWLLGPLLPYWLNDSAFHAWAYTRFFFITLPIFPIAVVAAIAAMSDCAQKRFHLGVRWATVLQTSIIFLFLFFTSTKVLDVSFGEKDTPWPAVISFLDDSFSEPTVVSIPIETNSFDYYSRAWTGRKKIKKPGEFAHSLASSIGGSTMESVVYVVDIVPFPRTADFEHFAIETFGTTSILYANRKQVSRFEHLRDLELILSRTIEFIEQNDMHPINVDWTYWRYAPTYSNMFKARGELPYLYETLATVQHALGNRTEAQEAKLRAASAREKTLLPGRNQSSWSMLKPYADLPGFRDWFNHDSK